MSIEKTITAATAGTLRAARALGVVGIERALRLAAHPGHRLAERYPTG